MRLTHDFYHLRQFATFFLLHSYHSTYIHLFNILKEISNWQQIAKLYINMKRSWGHVLSQHYTIIATSNLNQFDKELYIYKPFISADNVSCRWYVDNFLMFSFCKRHLMAKGIIYIKDILNYRQDTYCYVSTRKNLCSGNETTEQ